MVKEICFYLNDSLQRFISESDIIETWGTGEVESYHYFSGIISFQIPEAKEEVEQREVRGLCLYAEEQEFTVTGTYWEHISP